MGAVAQVTKKKILEELNEQQRLPVIDYEGPSIVIAGAGSGKTKTLVARTAYMIESGINPKSILLFTFTKKGADEIKERVIKYIGDKGKGVTVGTYHSFCARLLRRYVEALDIWKRNFSIYDAEDSEKILKEIIKNMGDVAKFINAATASKQISHWKDMMMSVTDAEADSQDDSNKVIIAQIYKIYSQELRAQNAMDFDDLIYVTIRLFERFPEIKAEVNRRYTYITADESQDSSPRDLELIYHLAGEKMNICLCGDDFQAIYSFRGSNIWSFFTFVEEFNLKKFFLGQNYRSTQTIVDAAQSVIEHNTDQFEKEVFSKNDKGSPAVIYTMPDEHSEAMRVAQIVKALQRKSFNLNDIAILYRTSFLSRKIEDVFISNGIKYRMLSGVPFYARKEIKDLMAYFRFLLNPSDHIALERILTRPKKGIGDSSVSKIFSCLYTDNCDILDIDQFVGINVPLKGRAKKGFELLTAIIQTLNEEKNSTPVELLQRLINLTGYFQFLKKEDEESYEDRKKNVEELCEIARGYESLEDFVGNMIINETDENKNKDDEIAAVNMMTIHGSKGLEFKAVIVVGCNQGTLPHYLSISDGNISEERRLFYVAMTRAKEFLFLTRAKQAIRGGTPKFQASSIFLDEIDPKYVRRM